MGHDSDFYRCQLIAPECGEFKGKTVGLACQIRQGTGNREQGTGNREQGIGNSEQGTRRWWVNFKDDADFGVLGCGCVCGAGAGRQSSGGIS